ncbi:hypothetical protein [Brevibacillus laterosporus]|uniref:Uncharacterized protein n=1 Tax=Brevibacillus laterosporus TaxID=1465 RepID=A0AAP3DHX4_BRELA|nr:hypothetical protein [Brevibacillus laterosporus]MCR8981654.1 hypothetical protein [Brevibacillus laterosporus]MCZ0808809.1 hypothetical protein [Brevibacillus laterosporus]MCZ0827218.1 hypothetical protein [Brevibacillus laterosporus]MCZ0850974.1 hypothetical protein [Brevibacillus laterosporus]
MKYREMVGGDYSIGRPFLTNAAAVGQAIYTRLKLLMEEWWEQLDDGLPLFQNILGTRGHPDNLQAVDLLVQARIIETPHVSQITDFQSAFDSRIYSFQCNVETTFGESIPISYDFTF